MGDGSPEPDAWLAHIHIPKTAGMAVQSVLKREFSPSHHLRWNDAASQWLTEISNEGDFAGRLLTGHISYSDLFFPGFVSLRPVYCVTVIREPLDRIVSLYNYNRSERHPNHEAFAQKHPTIDEFVKGFAKRSAAANSQSAWLCGRHRNRDLLTVVLNERYMGLCTQNRTDWYLSSVVSAMTGKSQEVHAPMTNSLRRIKHGQKSTAEDISPVLCDRFRAFNQLDYELYDTVCEWQEKLGAFPNAPELAAKPPLFGTMISYLRRLRP